MSVTIPQTAVTSAMKIGLPGQSATLSSLMEAPIDTGVSEEASAEIPFGVFVGQGTADDGMLLLAATTDTIKGLTVLGHSYAQGVEVGDDGILPTVAAGLAQAGEFYVMPEAAVAPGDEVHVRAVATGAEVAGALRATADGTDTIDITPFARWKTTGSSTVPAILSFNLSGVALATAD